MLRFGLITALTIAAPVLASEPKEAFHVPEHIFAGDPRGPYRTGTIEELWIDSQREETTTSNPADKRHLMVQIWYPAEFTGDPPRAPYILHRELYSADSDDNWLDAVKDVRTTSVLKAALARAARPFPLLIYSPGGGHPHFSATFQAEYLASQGYIVVGIGHTGLNRIARFPDGYLYRPDINDPDLSEVERKGLSEMEAFRLQVTRYAEVMMPIHVQDIRFVLDRLQALNVTPGGRFYQSMDLERVGALGWSLGGALSLQISRDEPRIKAAINLDGWLYTDVTDTGTHRPIMQMHGGAEEVSDSHGGVYADEKEVSRLADSLFWRLYSRTDADLYDLTLTRADHGRFSDRSLFEAAQIDLMHPRLAHDIVNGYTLEFFDKYLRQSVRTPLLSGEQVYPETALVKSTGK